MYSDIKLYFRFVRSYDFTETMSSGFQPPELITTEADVDPDSEDDEKGERKDSLDVHEEGFICLIFLLTTHISWTYLQFNYLKKLN